MTDETDPTPPAAPAPPAPAATDAAPADAGPTAATPPALPSISSAQVLGIWSKFGSVGQLVVGGSIAAVLIIIVGGVIDAWDGSGGFAIIVFVAAIAALIAASLRVRVDAGAMLAPIPLETVEFAAGVVATVLAILRLIEVVFDIGDLDGFGGLVGAVLTVGLVVAAGAILVGALRRDPTLRSELLRRDRGTMLAVAGLGLVVIAWAFNLSISYWRMSAGVTSVALVTFGAVLIVVQPRWRSVLAEVPLGWVGAGFGVVGLVLALPVWGQLMELGLTRIELDLTDYLPIVVWYLGILGVIAGGVLAGLPIWEARPKTAPVSALPQTVAPPPAPAAPVEPAVAPPTSPTPTAATDDEAAPPT